jgi:hypothetical protein
VADAAQSPEVSSPVRYWLGEIAAARKREKDWRKEGRRILEIYGGEKKDQTPFNVLYSNTETLLPALYNSQPRPVVQRRFKDDDPVGKAAAQAGQRVLEFSVDTNSEEYSSFDDVMTDAVLDALLPGRGATRVKYDADVVDVAGAEGKPATPVVRYELVCYESVKWDRWIFGFAKKWKRVPWIAFEHDVTKQEAEKLFSPAIAAKLTYSPLEEVDSEESTRTERDDKTDEDRKVARVYEIWDRTGGEKVRFVAPTFHENYLKVDEDPLELTGFFPVPEPLRFLRKSNDQMPIALYALYENQAKELNRITTRINKIVEAIKVRGIYAGTDSALEDLLKKEDNTLVPAGDASALFEGAMDKMIWLMPIEKLITVVQQLYIAREACKKVIYEITGISDILRGSSVASETLGAQEIKQQWGTMRLKRLQREVQRYARDLLRISLEIAAKKFSVRTFASMTGLPFPTAQAQQAAQGQIAIARAMQQPPPPAALQTLAQPPWEQVLATLRDNTQRQYRIDIETNSTVDLEATEDQKNIADVMTAIAQFLNGVAPLIQSGTMPFQVAQAMLLGIVRRYRFGPEIEDYIKAMQPPQPKDDGKAAQAQQEAQLKQMDLQRQAAVDQGKQQLEQQRLAHEGMLSIATFKFEQALEAAKADQSRVVELAKIEAQKASELAKLNAQRATEEMKARIQQETDLKKAALDAATKIEVAQIQAKKDAEAAAGETAVAGAQVASTTDLMTKILETQGRLLEAIAAPKQVVRGPDGRVMSLVPKAS